MDVTHEEVCKGFLIDNIWSFLGDVLYLSVYYIVDWNGMGIVTNTHNVKAKW